MYHFHIRFVICLTKGRLIFQCISQSMDHFTRFFVDELLIAQVHFYNVNIGKTGAKMTLKINVWKSFRIHLFQIAKQK